MEIQILKSLEYQLDRVTASDYLIALKVPLDENIQSLIMFILMGINLFYIILIRFWNLSTFLDCSCFGYF